MSTTAPRTTRGTDARMRDLRRWNLGVGVVHAAQAALILALGNGFSIPVAADVQTGPPGSELTVVKAFFDVNFAWGVALFLALAAADHLLVAAPGMVNWYQRHLLAGVNYARWIEYSLSASVMVVLIAMLTGVTNLYALIGLFSVNATMIGFGALMERTNPQRDRVTWVPFILGSSAGAVPWIAITIAIVVAANEGDGVPGFVYGIFVSLFLLFNCFAINQFLQYRRRGRFADYLFGEKVYIVLSLVAKTALAWQVFAGTLAD